MPPHWHLSDDVMCHSWRLAALRPCPVRKRFNIDHTEWPRLKPRSQIVTSEMRFLRHLSLHWDEVSTGGRSDQIGFLEVRRGGGWLKMSWYTGHSGWFLTICSSLSHAAAMISSYARAQQLQVACHLLVLTQTDSAEPFLHETGTLRCLQKEMATYRHWSVSLWRDPDDVPHCRILSPDKTKWRLISATLCGWRRCFVVDQLWFMTRIREEDLLKTNDCMTMWFSQSGGRGILVFLG